MPVPFRIGGDHFAISMLFEYCLWVVVVVVVVIVVVVVVGGCDEFKYDTYNIQYGT